VLIVGKKIQGCIYKLTNKFNGDAYIGQHKNVLTVEKRWSIHIYTAEKGFGSYIHNAVAEYGAENFIAEVIWSGPQSQLNEKEIWFIKKFHTFTEDPEYKGGYNLTPGGDGITQHSKASRKKMSEAALRIPLEKRSERGRSAAMTGTSEERSERGRKARAGETPEERIERARKGGLAAQAKLTPKERSEHMQSIQLPLEERIEYMRTGYWDSTPGERSDWGRKAGLASVANCSLEELSERGRSSWIILSPKERSDRIRDMWGKKSSGERTEIANRVWVTRRANGTAKWKKEATDVPGGRKDLSAIREGGGSGMGTAD
jgi:group I intron endonuclease